MRKPDTCGGLDRTALTFAAFPQECVAASTLELPTRDELHVLTGEGYRHDLFADPRKNRLSMRGISANPRGDNYYVHLDVASKNFDYVLKLCPYALDVRCYYPVFDVECIRRRGAIAATSRRDLVLVDRMLTVELRAEPGVCHLHAICFRSALLPRLGQLLADTTVSIEYLDPASIPEIQIFNCRLLRQWMRNHDLMSLFEPAQTLAMALRAVRSSSPLDQRLARLSRRLGYSINDAYTLLAASESLGFLQIDHRYRLSINLPLHLLPGPFGRSTGKGGS